MILRCTLSVGEWLVLTETALHGCWQITEGFLVASLAGTYTNWKQVWRRLVFGTTFLNSTAFLTGCLSFAAKNQLGRIGFTYTLLPE